MTKKDKATDRKRVEDWLIRDRIPYVRVCETAADRRDHPRPAGALDDFDFIVYGTENGPHLLVYVTRATDSTELQRKNMRAWQKIFGDGTLFRVAFAHVGGPSDLCVLIDLEGRYIGVIRDTLVPEAPPGFSFAQLAEWRKA